jgi:hypothetical protein
VGVFGFYYWFILVLITIYSTCSTGITAKEMNNENYEEDPKSIISTIRGILATIYSILSLCQNVQTVRNCSHITRFDAVHGVIILTLIGPCLSAAGGIFMVAQILDPTNLRVVVSACTLYAMWLLLHWVAKLGYFASVVKSTGVAKVTVEWDSVR